MTHPSNPRRRALVKAAAATGALQLAAPFIIKARGEETVKIGLDNPLDRHLRGGGQERAQSAAQLAIEQINAKGGILGRQAQLLVEDSTSGDAGTAVQKARKLIERDKVNFLLGNVNSALALAMADVSNGRRASCTSCPAAIPTPSPARPATGTSSASATRRRWKPMPCAGTLIKNAGKKWYYITPDYAFGHTLQAGLEKACAQARRHQGRRRPDAARHDRLLVLPHQGAGGEPRRHRLPRRRATT